MAATKFRSGAPVKDQLRERQVLAETGRRAVQLGLDPELAIRFVRRQIYASKIVQNGLLAPLAGASRTGTVHHAGPPVDP